MPEKDQLLIYWDENIVGTLDRNAKGRAVFQYAAQWLADDARPVSLSLPCQKERFSPSVTTAFFENLLPENESREILAFNNRFDRKDMFSFLKNFGRDCAGALSILPEGETPDFSTGRYIKMTDDLVKALDQIKKSPDQKLLPQVKQARLSIAGAQDKLPVYISGQDFFLPENPGSATTHIIKPENPGFSDLPQNEAFCLALAGRLGLPVPESWLMQLQEHWLFVVERYDRRQTKGRVVRIHQEDFCQALACPVQLKYQEGGGPGFKACRRLLDEYLSEEGQAARINFIKMAIFNFLIGNHDAHGKNFSVIHDDQIQLAPFYDLVSTQAYPLLENKFAMAYGKTYRRDRIGLHSINLFAKDMNIRSAKLAEFIRELADNLENDLPLLIQEHSDLYGASSIYPVLEKVFHQNIKDLLSFETEL